MDTVSKFFGQAFDTFSQFWTYIQEHQDLAIIWCVALVVGLIVMKILSKAGGLLLKIIFVALVIAWGTDTFVMLWDFVQQKIDGVF
jgi:hypothetical protein